MSCLIRYALFIPIKCAINIISNSHTFIIDQILRRGYEKLLMFFYIYFLTKSYISYAMLEQWRELGCKLNIMVM